LQQAMGRLGDFINGVIEGGLVALRWMRKATDLPHELQRRGADFIFRRRRLEIKQGSDIPAHRNSSRGRLDERPLAGAICANMAFAGIGPAIDAALAPS